ncbi:MgtC/SapB family protein [uncultured Ruegeria sp.]|uniref:MgtC/SapB family protein n=1 Tax=uncultured Ruegeria sp. TaxID=259304 RepID=UPI002612CEB8|nr:MgtC/SapB family protein [uncultured Ruegeria sp.]
MLIGSERQARQRSAGLQANTQEASSAAAFVVFTALLPDEVSPIRVAAQVVSGIGFLAAGLTFHHGFTIHGLNTVSTLRSSAAVGLMAGTVGWLFAIMMAGSAIFVNFGLGPLVKLLKRKTRAGVPLAQKFKILRRYTEEAQADARLAVLEALTRNDVRTEGFEKGDSADTIQTIAVLVSLKDNPEELRHKVVTPPVSEPSTGSVEWDSVPEA